MLLGELKVAYPMDAVINLLLNFLNICTHDNDTQPPKHYLYTKIPKILITKTDVTNVNSIQDADINKRNYEQILRQGAIIMTF